MLVMHAHQRPVTPSVRIGKPIHAGLEAVIMACLEKNPDRRPQTARELRERLHGLSFEHPWSEERAALWWKRYRPTSAEPAHGRPSEPPALSTPEPDVLGREPESSVETNA